MADTLVYGVIIDATTQNIITTATVSCPGQVVNNSGGSYDCTVSQEGTYTFTASAAGYKDRSHDILCGGGHVNQDFSLDPS